MVLHVPMLYLSRLTHLNDDMMASRNRLVVYFLMVFAEVRTLVTAPRRISYTCLERYNLI